MKLVNPTAPESPFYVGKCKDNTPPKHVIAEGDNAAETKNITIISKADGKEVKTSGVMYKSKKSAEYIYLKIGDGDQAQWLWIKDAAAFDHTTFNEVEKAEKKAPEKKEKKAKEEPVTLENGKSYSINGTIMTGEAALKRLGKKNVATSIQQGKVFEVDEEGNQVGGILGAEAAPEGDTGAA